MTYDSFKTGKSQQYMKGNVKMDKQTNFSPNSRNLIPVNTRTIGAPEGIYILYLEDYVHTFIRKVLSNLDSQKIVKGTDTSYQIETSIQPSVALYGRAIEENARYRLVISGAAALDSGNKIQQLNDTYFPSCTYIGTAYVSWNKDARLRFELLLTNTKVILDDFYIYYDQNEEMQNYLIEWNADKDNSSEKIILSPAEKGPRIRNDIDDAAKLGRIAQAYNREEAKVSFMWNVMNVLCLGFVVCVMAYGIVAINNYHKMKNMQANIDYCMAFVTENTSFQLPGKESVQTMQQSTKNNELETQKAAIQQNVQDLSENSQLQETFAVEEGTSQQVSTEAETTIQTQAESAQNETQLPVSQTQENGQPVQAQPKQYYIVQRGDTLRTICYDIYGDYSRVEEICILNQIEDPNNILYGQRLLLP